MGQVNYFHKDLILAHSLFRLKKKKKFSNFEEFITNITVFLNEIVSSKGNITYLWVLTKEVKAHVCVGTKV